MIGLVGQLLFGPLSDKYGRRLPLIISMTLFAVATIGCIYSYTIMQFVGWRLIVASIAGAGGIVISRSVAADKYSGRELAKMLALIGAINGVAPVAAPMGGGFLAGSVGWTGIFWCLFVLGIILLLGSIHFEESLPVEDRKGEKLEVCFSASSMFFAILVMCAIRYSLVLHKEYCLLT